MGDKIIAVDLGGTNLRVSLVKDNKILEYIKNKREVKYVPEIKRYYNN